MKSLNLTAPINVLSYGYLSGNILHELVSNNLANVSLFPIGQVQPTLKWWESVQQSIKNAQLYDPKADSIRIWHQFDLALHAGKGKHIGFPIFELDRFTEQELHHLQACDHLCVCSEWARDVLEANGVGVPTSIVPLGVDAEIFSEGSDLTSPNTVFLNVGKWEIRKGHKELADAFAVAFHDTRNVELWMVCHNPFYSDQENKDWEKYFTDRLGNKVKFIPRLSDQAQIAELMKRADCGVFPSKAEGWDLPVLEMMACGKPVITTNYSGHTEFCDHNNSYLIHTEEKEVAEDGKWFHGQGNWAKLDEHSIDSLIGYMRTIHHMKQAGQLRKNEEGIKTAQKFTWKNSAEKLCEVIC